MGNTQTFQQARRAVFRLAVWQCGLTLVTAASVGWFTDTATAGSVLTGGAIGVLAGLYQSQRMLRVDAGNQPAEFLRALWVSEALKIVLTAALFIAAIRVLQVTMVPTIVGYAMTYLVYWVALGTGYPWLKQEFAGANDRDRNWPDND